MHLRFKQRKFSRNQNKNDKMHLLASMTIISRNNMQSLDFYLTLSVSNRQKDR